MKDTFDIPPIPSHPTRKYNILKGKKGMSSLLSESKDFLTKI